MYIYKSYFPAPALLHFPVGFLINFYWIFQTGFLFSRFINVMCQVSIFWHCWFTRRRFLNIKIINHLGPLLGPQSYRTKLWKRITQGTFGQSLVKIDKMVSEICVILKKTSGRGWGLNSWGI